MIPSPCNILIGIATGGTVRSETMASVMGAVEVLKGHGVWVDVNLQIGGYVAHNRNNLARETLKRGFDYLMFIDNDQTFQPSAIQRLLDHDKDIVAAMYNARPAPGKPTVSVVKMVDPEKDPRKGKEYITEFPAQLFTCYGTGTGFMLINANVFKKMSAPWFVAYEEENGEHHTEDIEFCRKAGELGYEIWISPSIKVGHIGTNEF